MEESLTIPRLQALHHEWNRHPPLALMVAAYLGIKPEEKGTPEDLVQRLQGVPGITHS